MPNPVVHPYIRPCMEDSYKVDLENKAEKLISFKKKIMVCFIILEWFFPIY